MALEIVVFEFLIISQVLNLFLYLSIDIKRGRQAALAISVQLLQLIFMSADAIWLVKKNASTLMICGPIITGIIIIIIAWQIKMRKTVIKHNN